jgi:hypothetical protein
MSTDGSMVRLLLKEEPIAACGRLVTGINGGLSYKPCDSATIEGATGALSKQINMKSLALKGENGGTGVPRQRSFLQTVWSTGFIE